MIVDDTLVFSDHQAITADAASTNCIDIGAAGTAYGHAAALPRDLGKGEPIPLIFLVTEAFNTLTSLKISLQSDSTAAFSTPKEIASRTYALAEINATGRLSFPDSFPEGTDEEFIRVYYDVTGTDPTTGKIFAAVVAGRQNS